MGKFVIKPAKKGVRFYLKAGNGETVVTSQVYVSLASCKNGIASLKKIAPTAPIEDQTAKKHTHLLNPKFEVFTNRKGEFCYQLKAGNGQIIAKGGGYKAKKSCLNGIASIRKNSAGPVEIEH